MKTWWQPGPEFGYTLRYIDEHPWDTLMTMKEVLHLEPGSIEFLGIEAEAHRKYWLQHHPELVETGRAPIFRLETTPVHPHKVESEPRSPFKPYKDLDHASLGKKQHSSHGG